MRPLARHPRLRALLSAVLALGVLLAPVKPSLAAMGDMDCCPAELAAHEAGTDVAANTESQDAMPCHGGEAASTQSPADEAPAPACSADCLLACATALAALPCAFELVPGDGPAIAPATTPSSAGQAPGARLLRPPIVA